MTSAPVMAQVTNVPERINQLAGDIGRLHCLDQNAIAVYDDRINYLGTQLEFLVPKPHDYAKLKTELKSARRLLNKPCGERSAAARPASTTSTFHPFVGIEGGGGWRNTNFGVMPPFDVNGSGFVGGINGGVLFDVPGTNMSIGPRLGWQGGNMPGTTTNPPASSAFDYGVKTKSIAYEEADIQYYAGGGLGASLAYGIYDITVMASLGIAEVKTQVTGTSGAFQVTSSANQTGLTGTVGLGIPISQNFLGGELDAYAQYRFIALSGATVNIPGPVQINTSIGWIQGVNFGLQFRY